MSSDNTYRVGDKVVCGGFMYKIFKIDSSDDVIFFRPYFKSNKNSSTIRKIPRESLSQTTIREPISRKEIKDVVTFLKRNKVEKGFLDLNEAKEKLMSNNLFDAVRVLKWLWQDKQDDEKSFTFSKKRVYDMASERIVEEFAFVQDITLAEAEVIIGKHLKSSLKH